VIEEAIKEVRPTFSRVSVDSALFKKVELNSALDAKSNHARLVRYRARKQAADSLISRLLTRAVL